MGNIKSTIKQGGFSLIEVSLVLSIFIIMAAAALPTYSNLQLLTQLNESAAQSVQLLRLAREYSRASFNNSVYGVYFESNQPASQDRLILYKGSSYAARDEDYDRISIVGKTVSISTTLENNEINFAQGTGNPSTSGLINFVSKNNESETVNINNLGFAEIE